MTGTYSHGADPETLLLLKEQLKWLGWCTCEEPRALYWDLTEELGQGVRRTARALTEIRKKRP